MEIKFISYEPYPEFVVYEGGQMAIHVKLDIETDAFRIECFDQKRVFFIYDEIIKNKPVVTLLNEYSQQLGCMTKNTIQNSGEIEIESISYIYNLNKPLKKITILKNSEHPVLLCTLEMKEWPFPNKIYLNYILFSLSWFVHLRKEIKLSHQLA